MRIALRLLKFLNRLVDFARLEIKLPHFKTKHHIRRIFLNTLLAVGHLKIQFLRLNLCGLCRVIGRGWIELFQLIIEPAHDGVGNGAFQRRIVAHFGMANAVVKLQ